MVNAKNIFMTTLVTGLVIAAVGSKKFASGDWTTLSGDFVMNAKEAGEFTGRYYAENTAKCNIDQVSSVSKGEKCDKNSDMIYQMEFTGTDIEYYRDNKQSTQTNMKTGETNTQETKRVKGDSQVVQSFEWKQEGDKFVSEDGLEISVSNVQEPGHPIRALWGFLGKMFSSMLATMWNSWQSCEGALDYLGLNAIWCLAGILSGIVFAGLALWTGAVMLLPIIWSYIKFMCSGFALALIFILAQCVYMGYWNMIWDTEDLCEAEETFGRNLQAQGMGASQGGSGGYDNQGAYDCDGCRRLNIGASDKLNRALGGGGSSKNDCCRALGGGGGGGCGRQLGGGGGSDNGCGNGSSGCGRL